MSISRIDVLTNINGATSSASTVAWNVGDVAIVFGNYFPTAPAPSCTDTLGNVYSIVHNSGALYTAGPEVIYKSVLTVGGAAGQTITIGGTNASRMVAALYRGFVGTPTFLTATDYVEATGTGTAVSTATFSTTHAAELLVGMSSDTGGTAHPNPADLTLLAGGNFQISAYDSLSAHPTGLNAGTTVGWSTTLAASDTWYVAILGLYDAIAATAYPLESNEYF